MAKVRSLRNKAKQLEGPGSPSFRFSVLMDELEKRWPDPEPFSAQAGEPRYLAAMDAEREALRSALKSAIIALDDWTNTYAPEFCNEERVKEAQNRLSESGTLYYIATVVKQCKDALKE